MTGHAVAVLQQQLPATIVDEFDRADSTDIGSNWTEQTGDLSIVSEALTGTAANSVAYHNTDLQSSDHWAEITVTAGGEAAVTVRHSTAFATYYLGRWTNGGFGIYRRVNGAFTFLGSLVEAEPAKPYRVRLSANGSTITLSCNGAAKVTVTDTGIAVGNHVGVRINAASGSSIGKFRANAIGAPAEFTSAEDVTLLSSDGMWTWFMSPVALYDATA